MDALYDENGEADLTHIQVRTLCLANSSVCTSESRKSSQLNEYHPGVIQGSEQALSSETGYLSKEEYCSKAGRALFTDYSQREEIYDLFLCYRKKKRQLWQRDAADRYAEIVIKLPLLPLTSGQGLRHHTSS